MPIVGILRKVGFNLDRRTHPRITGPQIVLHVDDKQLRSLNWSLGGFLVEGLTGLLPGDRIEGELSPPKGGHKGDFSAEVVRIAAKGIVGARFINIDSRTFLALGAFKES